jgi:hypothetical protein
MLHNQSIFANFNSSLKEFRKNSEHWIFVSKRVGGKICEVGLPASGHSLFTFPFIRTDVLNGNLALRGKLIGCGCRR